VSTANKKTLRRDLAFEITVSQIQAGAIAAVIVRSGTIAKCSVPFSS
jgi:hypothetical protein